MRDDPEPWSANERDLAVIRRRTLEEFELELECPEPAGPDVPDPVLAEMLNGGCWHELASVRDDLARVRDRYDAAVLNARAAGLSWGEIGRVLGVSKQLLHRRFGSGSAVLRQRP